MTATPNIPVTTRAISVCRRSLRAVACTAHCMVTTLNSRVHAITVGAVNSIRTLAGIHDCPGFWRRKSARSEK